MSLKPPSGTPAPKTPPSSSTPRPVPITYSVKEPLINKISNNFCRNRYAYYLALILLCILIVIIGYLNSQYRCWQWKTDPLGALVLARKKKGLPIPRVAIEETQKQFVK